MVKPNRKSKLGKNVRLLLPNKKEKCSRTFVTGRSKSGKTTLVVEILKKYLLDRIHRFFVICPSFYTQNTFKKIRQFADPEDVYTERPTDEIFQEIRAKIDADLEENPDKMFLLFIDDLSSDSVTNHGRKGAFASLSTEAPHINLSIIALFQQAKTCSPAFRNNADNFIIFPPADNFGMKCFNEEQTPYIYDAKKAKEFSYLTAKIWEKNRFVFIHRPARIKPISFENFDKQIVINK